MIDFSKDGELAGSNKPVKQDIRKTKSNRDRNFLVDYDFADRDVLQAKVSNSSSMLGRVVSEEEKIPDIKPDIKRFDDKHFDTEYQNNGSNNNYEMTK